MSRSVGLWRRPLGIFWPIRRASPSRRKGQAAYKPRGLRLEALEQRQLLSVSPLSGVGSNVQIVLSIDVTQGTATQVVPLSKMFPAIAVSTSNVQYQVVADSNSSLFTVAPAVIPSQQLLLRIAPEAAGSATLTVSATAGGQSSDAALVVTVLGGDGGPASGGTTGSAGGGGSQGASGGQQEASPGRRRDQRPDRGGHRYGVNRDPCLLGEPVHLRSERDSHGVPPVAGHGNGHLRRRRHGDRIGNGTAKFEAPCISTAAAAAT